MEGLPWMKVCTTASRCRAQVFLLPRKWSSVMSQTFCVVTYANHVLQLDGDGAEEPRSYNVVHAPAYRGGGIGDVEVDVVIEGVALQGEEDKIAPLGVVGGGRPGRLRRANRCSRRRQPVCREIVCGGWQRWRLHGSQRPRHQRRRRWGATQLESDNDHTLGQWWQSHTLGLRRLLVLSLGLQLRRGHRHGRRLWRPNRPSPQ